MILRRWLGGHRDADGDGVEVLDKNLVLVDNLVFYRIRTAFLCLSRHDEALRLLVVGNGERRVSTQRQLFLEGVLVFGKSLFILCRPVGLAGVVRLVGLVRLLGVGGLFVLSSLFILFGILGYCLLETIVGFLQEGEMVVERFHIQRTVDVQLTVVGNGVTQINALLCNGTALPVVSGIIADVGIDPVEDGQLVQRHLIGGRKRLTVVQR